MLRLASILAGLSVVALPSFRVGWPGHFDRIAAHGAQMAREIRWLLQPVPARVAVEAAIDRQRRETPLAKTRQIVGSGTIDIYDWQLGLLFQHGLAWAPRPTLQGYCAFTPALAALNAASLHGSRAPDFVLYRHEALDSNQPVVYDGPAIREVFRRYRPLRAEDGYYLLQRRQPPPPSAPETEVSPVVETALGDWLTPPAAEAGLLLFADLELSWSGRLREFAYKPAELAFDVALDDGRRYRFSVSPAAARLGIPLQPCLATEADFHAWLTTGRSPRVTDFRFVVTARNSSDYRPVIRLYYRSWPDPFVNDR